MKALTYVEIDVPSFVPASPEELQTFRFAMPTDYLPPSIEAIPSIDNVSLSPATVSLGKDLGQRASITISFRDHPHVFNGEPYGQGTFWGKWRGRYGTKLRGREVRIIRGQLGQPIEEMDTRYYIIDTVDGPTMNSAYTIVAKDILKLADDDRAQAPILSNGSLAGSIDDSTDTATLSPVGIGNFEYPASGWVCIGGKEVCEFTRSGDVLTISRGEFGTVAEGHDAGDRVQLVLRYTGDDVADIIEDLLTNYADVPGSYIDLAAWQQETADHLGVIYARTITEPTSVNKLVSELIEQAALAVWWDDRARQVRLQVLREIATDTDTFDQERIIQGSFSVKEQPTKRISQIWTYYGQRDPTDSGANEDNFRAALATVDLEAQAEYGSAEIAKVQAAWVETETAANRLNSIQISRFRDPPRSFAFDLFRDVAVLLGGGYQVSWWGNQDETGVEVPTRIQVTKVALYPDRVHVEAEEMLAFGVVVLVNVVFLLNTGGVFTWEVPATWNDDDNEVHTIGGGAAGADNNGGNGGKGGGAGAYSRVTNLNLTPAAMISYRVGDGGDSSIGAAGEDGGDTWFNGATLGASSVGAKGGQGGSGRTGGGQGGQASAGVGTVKTNGGNGGDGAPAGEDRAGGGGGGGSGGPNGHGNHGGTQGLTSQDAGSGGGAADNGSAGAFASGSTGGVGGNNRFNFGGGNASQPNGDEGGGGKGGDRNQDGGRGGDGEQLWTQTVTPIISAGPGAGGGGGGDSASGGDGGLYGGAGGGAGRLGQAGDGRQGIIVIRWREAA